MGVGRGRVDEGFEWVDEGFEWVIRGCILYTEVKDLCSGEPSCSWTTAYGFSFPDFVLGLGVVH